ncbi:sugar phosphate isomerase/epimerase family protein [Cellulophaga omnivescoria]|uniref:sugar phosphate isomerase/epimerase family protein n=1 Tax=Cellulophaga omnivescoria TaxID=1888890 RepID=UPI0022F112C9|nr:sugar phosphate isomerase/epimerase family protein [Cellulophaga omnivescoria]WBU90990.1 sugar phosphate isomerase/epimerase [Cellulophaga omnivescoria]
MKVKKLVKQSVKYPLILLVFCFASCKDAPKKNEEAKEEVAVTNTEEQKPFFKLSLAQWSLHKQVFDGGNPYDFAEKAKSLGFTGLEYVSALYNDVKEANYSDEAMAQFIAKSNEAAKKHGMTNVLIMIDGQGDLALADKTERKKAVENHYKWVKAAAEMGCHAIRVNLSGSTNEQEWVTSSIDGLKQLGTFAKEHNINVIVENHGGLSSNGKLLSEVMSQVNMDNVGTLPDFGNFCIKKSEEGCEEMYDNYKGVTELMPYAKAVSAKSYNFDAEGKETKINYSKMLQIVKDAGYTGFIGVEYEGDEKGEEEGIIATRDLLVNAAKNLK